MPQTGFTSYSLPVSVKAKTRKPVPTNKVRTNRAGQFESIKKRAEVFFYGPATTELWCSSCRTYSIKKGDMYAHCIDFGQTGSFCIACCSVPKRYKHFRVKFSLKRGPAWKIIDFVGSDRGAQSYVRELEGEGRIVRIETLPMTIIDTAFDITPAIVSRQNAEASARFDFEAIKEIPY